MGESAAALINLDGSPELATPERRSDTIWATRTDSVPKPGTSEGIKAPPHPVRSLKRGLAASLGLDSVSVDRDAFVESYREGADALARNYARVLEGMGERQVHQARTATRRVEAHMALLPRRLRSGEAKELEGAYRNVMETTAMVRDMDVLIAKLSGLEGTSAVRDAALRARRRAGRSSERALVLASQSSLPPLRTKDIPRTRLQRRFEKVAGRLADECDALFPEVVGNPSDMKLLHRLRIHIKRIRYLLEAVAPGESRAVSTLESLQDSLGSVHDWDVSIAFVMRVRPRWEGVPGWVAQRDQEFDKFSRFARRLASGNA